MPGIVIVNGLFKSDTNWHDYTTDPYTIFYPQIGAERPQVQNYTIFTLNNTNVPITVQPIYTITSPGIVKDMNLIPAYTVNSGDTDSRFFAFNDYPIQYLSVRIQFQSVPSYGGVLVYAIINGEDPIPAIVPSTAPFITTTTTSTTSTPTLTGTYAVTFIASGYNESQSGNYWQITVGNLSKTSTQNTITIYLTNGQYSYSIFAPYYTVSPSSGSFLVQNNPVNITLNFISGAATPEQSDIYNNNPDSYLFGVSTAGSDSYNNESDTFLIGAQQAGKDVYNNQPDSATITNS